MTEARTRSRQSAIGILEIMALGIVIATIVAAQGAGGVEITHAVASGDVTNSSAVIWSRADANAKLRVTYGPAIGWNDTRVVVADARADADYTAQAKLTNLDPDTLYRYQVQFVAGRSKSRVATGTFRTAPAVDAASSVRLVWSGDLAGQTYCRRPDVGYRIFTPMMKFRADFFVANGDMIYADGECPEQGTEPGWRNVDGQFPAVSNPSVDWQDRVQLADMFNAHWRYNRADPAFQAFLAATPMYVQWDDHEVINDFGAPWQTYPPQPDRAGYPNVVAMGRKSFFDYHPVDPAVRDSDGLPRIYRSYRWGAHVELFILDARSYRSPNTDDDSADKTMLGRSQLAWLKSGLVESDATWKIISNDVPLAVPTGSRADEFGRDAFASGATQGGFETELLDLVRHLDAADAKNVVFIATDVHSAAQVRYENDYDGDGDLLLFHELIAGPLSAVRGAAPVALDGTLRPVMIYGEGDLFNYGAIHVEAGRAARLSADVRDEFGNVRPGSELTLLPR